VLKGDVEQRGHAVGCELELKFQGASVLHSLGRKRDTL